MKRRLLVACLLSPLLASLLVPSTAGAGVLRHGLLRGCDGTWQVILGGKGGLGVLRDVAAVSADDVWIGGELSGARGPYLLHWHGSWSRVPIPGGPSGIATVEAIDARNADDIWAVGERAGTAAHGRYPYAIHWNGRRWTSEALPTDRRGRLVAVVALRDETWAIGNGATSGKGQPFVFHRTRGGWRRVEIPVGGSSEVSLTAITGTSADDVWLAGIGGLPFRARGFVEHWNGSRWSFGRKVPFQPWGIDEGSSSNVMVVGRGDSAALWNGRRWKDLPTPTPADFPQGKLLDVVWTSPSSAWAVGAAGNSSSRFYTPTTAYVERWNGSRWRLDSQAPFGSHSVPFLAGVASAEGTGWAVGSRYPKGGFIERRC